MISPGSAGPALRSRWYEEVTVRHNGVFSSQPRPLTASSKVKMIQISHVTLARHHLGHHHSRMQSVLTLASSNRRKNKRQIGVGKNELEYSQSLPLWVGHCYVSLSPPHTISISMQVLRTLVRSPIVLRRLKLRHNDMLLKAHLLL